jgi:hypothetical protein
VTPLSTQAYAPVLPLFVTDALGLPVVVAGLFVAALAAGSLCSHMLVARLLKYNSVRSVLLVAHLVRTLAAILYVAAVVYRNDVRRASALLLSSRLLHGLTLNTSALPVRAQAAGCSPSAYHAQTAAVPTLQTVVSRQCAISTTRCGAPPWRVAADCRLCGDALRRACGRACACRAPSAPQRSRG